MLAVAAGLNALDHIGDGVTRYTFFNISGIVLAAVFLIKTPPEKNYTWKERRGEPPDWGDLTSRS